MNQKRIFLAADSTVAYNDISTYPQTGWGQVIHLYLQKDIAIHNHAMNGRSSMSFIKEGRLKVIEDQLQEGDFLVIQFGHNDQKEDPERGTDPYTTYQTYLTKYIEVARAHKAVPILITSLYRRHFDETGSLKENVHGEYPAAIQQLGEKLNVPIIDLCGKSESLLKELGDKESKTLFMNLKPGVSKKYPDGIEDNTHLQYAGAVCMAGLVAEGLKELGAGYAELVKY